ncbi:hypothetical protein [Rhizobium leguminosarum]
MPNFRAISAVPIPSEASARIRADVVISFMASISPVLSFPESPFEAFEKTRLLILCDLREIIGRVFEKLISLAVIGDCTEQHHLDCGVWWSGGVFLPALFLLVYVGPPQAQQDASIIGPHEADAEPRGNAFFLLIGVRIVVDAGDVVNDDIDAVIVSSSLQEEVLKGGSPFVAQRDLIFWRQISGLFAEERDWVGGNANRTKDQPYSGFKTRS